MEEIEIKGETYKVNQGLTKKLGLPGWVVYKDPGWGLWGYNKELDIMVYLLCKKISLKDPSLDKVVWFWRWLIIKRATKALKERAKEALGEEMKLQRVNRVWILTINGIEYKFNALNDAIEAIRERKCKNEK